LRYLAPLDHFYLVLGIGDIYEQATFILFVQAAPSSSSSASAGYDIMLIDPRTGDCFNVTDPRIPLSEIGLVVSHDNMYANVQLSGTPYRMVWDLLDNRYWHPLFASSAAANHEAAYIDCVQRERLDFIPISDDRCALIEERLKKLIRKNLKSWRRDRAPMYQERVGQILKEVLVELERERRDHANRHQDFVLRAHQAALAEFQSEYTAVGMPICTPYKDEDFEEMISALSESCVHDIGTDNVRYALAVHVQAYTGTSIAVWAYLVALLPTERRLRI
jgi:coiled-coil and C2 domain-containing protein 2A